MLHTSGDAYRLHLTQRVLGLCGTEIETGRMGDRDGRRRVRIVEIAVQCRLNSPIEVPSMTMEKRL